MGISIDCFAGGGGASVGYEMFTGKPVDIAINHDPEAIRMHRMNHPNTLHLTEDIFTVDLKKHVAGRKVDFMWTSPDCTSHSKAKGDTPRESGLRMLPWSVFYHSVSVEPEVVMMENVEEIQKWGPLDNKGKPIKLLEGTYYNMFIRSFTEGLKEEPPADLMTLISQSMKWGKIDKNGRPLNTENAGKFDSLKEHMIKGLGYDFKCKTLVAADFGAPTTRKRWYAVFRNDGKEIKFPEPTHNKEQWLKCGDYLDWSDLGKSIFNRKKPLAEATQKRIANGIKKYILDNPHPYIVKDENAYSFLIQYHGEQKNGESRGQLLTEPIKTIDTSNRYGLVTAFVTKFYKTGIGQCCDEPLHTITTSPGHFGIVSAFLIKYYGQGCGQVCNDPLGTITTKDRFGLVTVVIDGERYIIKDVFLRMLKPEELKILQGFPKDYIIDRDIDFKPYPIKEQVARIGNSVVPIMAKALVSVNCPYLKVGERKENIKVFWKKTQFGNQMAFA